MVCTDLNGTNDVIPASAGIGLRFPHHRLIDDTNPAIGWLEIHAENYMGGGEPLRYLDRIRQNYPIALHGVGLSLGSAEGLNPAHLNRLTALAARIQPGMISEHLSWSVAGGIYLGDLMPLPMTEESLDIVSTNILRMQDRLRRTILVENPSSYLLYRHSTIPEWEFLSALAQRTGCKILCDVNNIHVSAANHGWSAQDYLSALPPATIGEIHLAGHSIRSLDKSRRMLIDDHGAAIDPAVWSLYAEAIRQFGPIPTLIERDNNIPSLEILIAEADMADSILATMQQGNGHANAA